MNFRAVLAMPRHTKVWVSFELFGVLGIYNFEAIQDVFFNVMAIL